MKILMHPCWLAPPAREGTTMTCARLSRPALVLDVRMSNSPSRPRGAFLRPGFATLLHSPRVGGGAERRETFGCVRGTRGTRHNAACQALGGALRPMTRDARLSALHRGGFSPGAALPSPA